MSKKIKLAGILLGAVISTSTMAVAGENGKCGAGKCGGEMKKEMKKDGKCGAGKCGGDMKKEMKSSKCGAGKCGGDMKKGAKKEMKSGKCGAGKCGSK